MARDGRPSPFGARILAVATCTSGVGGVLHVAGVSKYKGGDASALPATARKLRGTLRDASWAKKSSVWLY